MPLGSAGCSSVAGAAGGLRFVCDATIHRINRRVSQQSLYSQRVLTFAFVSMQ